MAPNPLWLPVEDRRCYGVAKYNFEGKDRSSCPLLLRIHLGEAVLIKGECGEWFFARKFEGEEEGIVPKSYIHLKECSVIRNGDIDIVLPKTPTLAQEINAALREWYNIAKGLFILSNTGGKDWTEGPQTKQNETHNRFLTIRKMILDLHECRKRLISSNLTVEGLKELKKEVAIIIDRGNSLLKLDMVVRDENGNPLDALSTSTVELFRQHKKASQMLKKNGRGSQRGSNVFTHSSHSLLVTIEKISWRIVDECEVRFFLYDAKEKEEAPFTESVQVTLKAGVVPKTPFKLLFTDLGKSDFERQKVFLVAYVVRIGPMEFKEPEPKRDNIPFSDKKNNIQVRRPYGVAAKEITHVFRENSRAVNDNDNEVQAVLYLPCGGDETMDETLKKLIATTKGGEQIQNGKDAKAVGLLARMSMVAGTPLQIQDEQPLLLRGNPIITRKMGFPEVILPNDIRNDLFVNLIRGEFHRGAKTTDRNVEVTVSVHNERGHLLGGILFGGNGASPLDQYKSVVYYHSDKPRWNEFFKISLPMNIEEFSTAHVKFTFKHRSSSDSKDRTEKPFALAYLRLKEQEGTAIRDALHDLMLYKIDPKHYKESEVQYLSLPYVRAPTWSGTSKPSCPGFSCSAKDSFFVRTTLCSTNFTQNADLLELLLWVTQLKKVALNTLKEQPDISKDQLVSSLLDALRKILQKVTKAEGEEIVKFLHPIFDALFLILVDPMEQIQTELRSGRQSIIEDFFNTSTGLVYENGSVSSATCDRSVFDCLLHIFGLILDHKYQNFQSVLNLYIEDNFSSTLAYKKLAKELEHSIEKDLPDKVLKVMKSIEFFFKFIIKSFQIHKRLRYIEFGRTEQDRDDEEGFERIIESLFKSMCRLLERRDVNDPYIGAEGGCLKHIPSVIADLIKVFPARKLSEHFVELCCVVPPGKLMNIKLTFLMEIVHSELFIDTECRFTLLPSVAKNIQSHLPGNDEEMKRRSQEIRAMNSRKKLDLILGVGTKTGDSPLDTPKEIPVHSEETEKCVELLGDVMHILHRQSDDTKISHICYVMQILLRPIIFSIGTIGEDDILAGNMVAIFLALLREMKSYHYGILINSLKGETGNAQDPYKQGLLKFLNDVLVVMKNLFHTSYFPNDWNAMILLQNSIVLTALEHFASTIKAEFADPFEEQPWNNFFICAVSFLTQPSLQVEEFFQAKRNYIMHNYGDMRKRGADLIRIMWFSLGESKRIRFVPMMVGTFLDMAFVPEPDLRKSTIPIFFDMMHCEFDQDRPLKSFKQVEDELIKKIVEGIEGGKGDLAFKDIFHETMSDMCEHNNTGLKELGLSMVSTVSKLMDLLLQYREVINEDNAGNRMSCIVNLLDFSKEINRKELYLRYLYKLHDLHIQSNNFTEAAFTLKLHSRQLEWTDDEVPTLLRPSNRHATLLTQIELKDALYNDIINYFDKAKMWECALEVCNELTQQNEDSYNYSKLPKLHRQIADFYDKILDHPRFEPEYFRVAFFGGGFPTFLQDKVFVYRGLPFEKLSDFEGRMLGRYLQAELLRSLVAPSDDIRLSTKQYLQICNVHPVMTTSKRMSGMKYADENIRKYYRANEIEKFTYSRPYHQEPRDSDNEFASLWLDRYTLWTSQSFPGIMSWFPVVRDTLTKVRPIVNAIESLEKANEKMREMVLAHCVNDKEDLGQLTMKLNGIVDAAVNGGVANYEKAFISTNYLNKNPNDADLVEDLKRLIFIQVPIIEHCLRIHERKSQASMLPLHKRMEELFEGFVKHLEEAYGVNASDLRDENLAKEMSRAHKKQQAMTKRQELLPSKDQSKQLEFVSGGHAGHRGSTALGRGLGSFSSTVSLYQNASSAKAKSSVSIAQRNYFRRSGTSFSGSMEGDQLSALASSSINPPMSATLPRNGQFFSNSFTKLAPVDSESEGASHDSLIPLTQTLISQRPPRTQMEQRKSHSWSTNSDGGISSGLPMMSGNSMDALRPINASDPSSRTSTIDSESCDEDTPPPALPPKARDRADGPPPPPPRKPPLKQFRDIIQWEEVQK